MAFPITRLRRLRANPDHSETDDDRGKNKKMLLHNCDEMILCAACL